MLMPKVIINKTPSAYPTAASAIPESPTDNHSLLLRYENIIPQITNGINDHAATCPKFALS